MKLVAIIFVFVSSAAFGQIWPFEYWHDGKLVLETGDTLKGKIKYEIDSDIIQLEQTGTLQSFTSRKIVYYEIFDATSSRYRQFYSIPYSSSGGYKSPTFFELVAEGKLTLLSQEALENKSYNSGYSGYYGYGSISRVILVNKYFVLDDKGQMEIFSGTKKDLFIMMDNRNDEVKKFIKVNRLDVAYKYDLARIFEYYNSLFKKK